MSKQYNIRWRDKDIKELNRIVKNFNSKVKRVQEKNPEYIDFLPDKISVKQLKSKIDTRTDFARELNSIKRFSKRGTEQLQTTPSGIVLTKYEIKETKNKVRIVNIKRAYERKKLDVSTESGTMGQITKQNLRPKQFNLNKTNTEWDKFVSSLEKEITSKFKDDLAETYKQNYINSITKYLGDDGKELLKMIKGMTPEEIYQNSIENPILSIGFTSDPLPTKTIANSALKEWEKIKKK